MEEFRQICYDAELKVEAYRFQGVTQKFPSHFHEHFVIGCLEQGPRCLICRGREFPLHPGDMLFLAPGKSHGCQSEESGPLEFLGLAVPDSVMWDAVRDLRGKGCLPRFQKPVVPGGEFADIFRELHRLIFRKSPDFEKEELFYFLLRQLLDTYEEPVPEKAAAGRESAERVRAFVEEHYGESLSLSLLAKEASVNRWALLRLFTQLYGVTPYQYLLTVRVNKAKELLAQGADPAEAGLASGFADQSHFTRRFKSLLGLTPGQYRDIFSK